MMAGAEVEMRIAAARIEALLGPSPVPPRRASALAEPVSEERDELLAFASRQLELHDGLGHFLATGKLPAGLTQASYDPHGGPLVACTRATIGLLRTDGHWAGFTWRRLLAALRAIQSEAA